MTDLMTFLELEHKRIGGDKEFVDWARDYMTNVNRPTTVFYPRSGLGITFAQGQRVTISKNVPPGGMLSSGGVAVTQPQQTVPMIQSQTWAVGRS